PPWERGWGEGTEIILKTYPCTLLPSPAERAKGINPIIKVGIPPRPPQWARGRGEGKQKPLQLNRS
ncbi:MAG TPA: hypothetical protein DEF47_14780, partial [Herpetosiphon sp.]|nr:hypothetical protein [Herpetosiphon sp.]